jgi:hypothetical protein
MNNTFSDILLRKYSSLTYPSSNVSIPRTRKARADLISGLFASTDHNSGRMTFGPDGMDIYDT